MNNNNKVDVLQDQKIQFAGASVHPDILQAGAAKGLNNKEWRRITLFNNGGESQHYSV